MALSAERERRTENVFHILLTLGTEVTSYDNPDAKTRIVGICLNP